MSILISLDVARDRSIDVRYRHLCLHFTADLKTNIKDGVMPKTIKING